MASSYRMFAIEVCYNKLENLKNQEVLGLPLFSNYAINNVLRQLL
jgi:hypothetical protein